MSKAQQSFAFDDDGPRIPQGAAAALLAIEPTVAPLSKAQQTFNRLIEQIRRQRELLQSWQEFIPRFRQRLASDMEPAMDALLAARRRLALLFDETLTLPEMLEPIARQLGRPLNLLALPRAVMEQRGLLPGGSPWSGRWMSVLSNDRSKTALDMRFTSVTDYVPRLVQIARALPGTRVIGYERRAEELELARDRGSGSGCQARHPGRAGNSAADRRRRSS